MLWLPPLAPVSFIFTPQRSNSTYLPQSDIHLVKLLWAEDELYFDQWPSGKQHCWCIIYQGLFVLGRLIRNITLTFCCGHWNIHWKVCRARWGGGEGCCIDKFTLKHGITFYTHRHVCLLHLPFIFHSFLQPHPNPNSYINPNPNPNLNMRNLIVT